MKKNKKFTDLSGHEMKHETEISLMSRKMDNKMYKNNL